jgi:glycosyltransferase involved in cell wall biosynthesis
LVPARDAKALSNALLRLIKNPELRVAMGHRGRKIVLKEFSSDKIISKTLDLYEELTG